jgi:hypothetical protein
MEIPGTIKIVDKNNPLKVSYIYVNQICRIDSEIKNGKEFITISLTNGQIISEEGNSPEIIAQLLAKQKE